MTDIPVILAEDITKPLTKSDHCLLSPYSPCSTREPPIFSEKLSNASSCHGILSIMTKVQTDLGLCCWCEAVGRMSCFWLCRVLANYNNVCHNFPPTQ